MSDVDTSTDHRPHVGGPGPAPRRVIVVTGTDTGVGKTVATAALAVREQTAGRQVLVIKPAQTGIGGPTPDVADIVTVDRLTGVHGAQHVALDEPLAPDIAARRQGVAIPTVSEHQERIVARLTSYDVVVVEGAGGLLVRLDADGATLADLAVGLAGAGVLVEVVVVCRAGLGTLNHTALTVEALRRRGLEPAGLIIGSWPDDPDVATACNREELARVTGVPLLAVLPEGIGALDTATFTTAAPTWFATSARRP